MIETTASAVRNCKPVESSCECGDASNGEFDEFVRLAKAMFFLVEFSVRSVIMKMEK